MDLHLETFEVVEFLSDLRLVPRGQSRPRLVRPPVVLLRLRHFDIVVESDDLQSFPKQLTADFHYPASLGNNLHSQIFTRADMICTYTTYVCSRTTFTED